MVFEQTFWIAANIIFDIDNGRSSNVLTLVNRIEQSSDFKTLEQATTYVNFIQRHAPHIQWFVDGPTPQRPFGYRIRGVQLIEG